MVEQGAQNQIEWEAIFPDQKKREAVKAFIDGVSSMERLEKVALLRLKNGQEMLYAFFPKSELTKEEMERLSDSLDEAFSTRGINVHDWPVLAEMTDENYRQLRETHPKIREAEEIIIWQKPDGTS